MPSGIAPLLLAAALTQAPSISPVLTPRTSLPITRGPITFVEPSSACPPHKGQPVRLGATIVEPPLLDYTPPREAPSSGRVLVEATIQQDGTVGSVKVLRGPPDLHEVALEAVRQWKFARACVNGIAIPLIHVVVVTTQASKRSEPIEPMRIGGEVSPPQPIRGLKIRWPGSPTQCYQLGTAAFEGVVDRNGNMRDVKLIKGPDNRFTQAARAAIEQQTFRPALYRGKPVNVIYHVSITHVPVKQVKGPC